MVNARRDRRRRRGRSNLGCLAMLLIVIAVVYFGVTIGRVYLRYYEYQDAMVQEARFAAHNTNDVIVDHLRAKADSLGLPESAKRINIRRKPGVIWIWADYIEEVEFPGIVREISFEPRTQRVF